MKAMLVNKSVSQEEFFRSMVLIGYRVIGVKKQWRCWWWWRHWQSFRDFATLFTTPDNKADFSDAMVNTSWWSLDVFGSSEDYWLSWPEGRIRGLCTFSLVSRITYVIAECCDICEASLLCSVLLHVWLISQVYEPDSLVNLMPIAVILFDFPKFCDQVLVKSATGCLLVLPLL